MAKFFHACSALTALSLTFSLGVGCSSDSDKAPGSGALVDNPDGSVAADSGGGAASDKPSTSENNVPGKARSGASGSTASDTDAGPATQPKGGNSSNAAKGGAAVPGTSSAGAGFDKLASTYCGKLAECAAFGFERTYTDAEDCRKRRSTLYGFWASLPDTGWTSDNLDACTKAIGGLGCRDFLDDKGMQACAPKGKRKPGEACNTREQCETRFCDAAGYSCGVCGTAPVAGASCTEDNDCPDEHACLCDDGTPHCNSRRCLRLRDAEEECSRQAPCGSGLNCVQGHCKAAPNKEGDQCNPAAALDCDTVSSGLVCTDKGCAKLKPAEVCSPTEYCKDSKTTCEVSEDGQKATCAPVPADNGSCDLVKGRLCRFPALCVSGTCQLPGAGPACQTSSK